MAGQKYVVVEGRHSLGLKRGQKLEFKNMNRDRIKMLLDHGFIEPVESEGKKQQSEQKNKKEK